MNIRQPSALRLLGVLLASACLATPAYAVTQEAVTQEKETNNSCGRALNVGAYGAGQIDGVISAADSDHFALALPAGSTVNIALLGAPSGVGTLEDPVVGAFNSVCAALASDDDGGYGSEAQLQLVVPADGLLVIAVGGYPDTQFKGLNEDTGSYQLQISEEIVSGVSGLVLDASTGAPIAGSSPLLVLRRCDNHDGDTNGLCDEDAGSVVAASDGSYLIDGSLLEDGDYQLSAYADDFEDQSTPIFSYSSGTLASDVDLLLQPMPISITQVETCLSPILPGATCNLIATVINRTAETVEVDLWAAVEAYNTGSKYGSSRYISGVEGRQKPIRVTLAAASTVELSVPFLLPSTAPSNSDGYVDLYIARANKSQQTYDMGYGLHYYVQVSGTAELQTGAELNKQLEARHRSVSEQLQVAPKNTRGRR